MGNQGTQLRPPGNPARGRRHHGPRISNGRRRQIVVRIRSKGEGVRHE